MDGCTIKLLHATRVDTVETQLLHQFCYWLLAVELFEESKFELHHLARLGWGLRESAFVGDSPHVTGLAKALGKSFPRLHQLVVIGGEQIPDRFLLLGSTFLHYCHFDLTLYPLAGRVLIPPSNPIA